MSRKRALWILGSLLLVVLLWRYFDDTSSAPPMATTGSPMSSMAPNRYRIDEEGSGPRSPQASATASRQTVAPTKEVKDLQIALLDEATARTTPGRNPWHFYVPPPPPPPPPPAPPSAEEKERMRRLEEERQRRLQEEQARARYVAEHTPPPFTMAYLGTFGPSSRPFAVFNDGKTLYNVREGERIAGKFVLAHIGYESADVSYVDLPEAPPQRVKAGAAKTGPASGGPR